MKFLQDTNNEKWPGIVFMLFYAACGHIETMDRDGNDEKKKLKNKFD